MKNVNLFSVAASAPPSWPKKLTQAKRLRKVVAGIALLLLLFVAPKHAFSQGCTNAWPGTTIYSSPVNVGNPALSPSYSNSQSIGPGNFFYFTAYNGLTYEFFNCSSGNWDTDVLIYRNDNGTYLGGHDGTSTCGWRSNNNQWTNGSGYSGTVRVILPTYYNCASPYGWNSSLSSTIMQVRETVPPTPATPTSNSPQCGSVTLNMNQTAPTGYTYYWQTTTNGTSTSNSASSFADATAGTRTYYLRARSASGNWGAASGGVTITVNAIPAAAGVSITSGSSGQCGGSITLTGTGGSGGTLYWQGSTSGGTSTSTANSASVSSSGTYYFRARSSAGCWGTQGSISVTINSVPTNTSVAITSGTSGQCGGSIGLTATGGSGGTMYWQGTTSGGTSTATPTTTQTVSSSGTYYFNSRSSAGCWGTQGSQAVVINTIPSTTNVAITSGTSGQCGGSIGLTASGGGGGTIYWQGTTNNGTSTATATTTQTVTSSGTYYFRSYNPSGACWGAQGSVAVVINTIPATTTVSIGAGSSGQCGGTITLNAAGGSGGTIYWQNTTSGGTSTATPSTSQSVSSSGTYFFNSRSSAGCWGTQGSQAVVINTVPAAVSVSGGGTFCTNGSQNLTASGGAGGTIYWQNTTSNGTSTATASSSQNVSSSGTYYFRSRSPQGCWGPEGSASVTINPIPAAVTVSGGGTGCNGQATLTASGGAIGTIYWQNTTSNGTSTATPATSRNVTANGTYYFRSFNGNCWGPQGSAAVTIVPTINLSVGGGTTQSTCGASNGTACVTASGGTGTYTYAWSGGGASSCKGSVPSGSYPVTVTSGGCTATTTIPVSDAGSPTANITSQTNVSCFGGNNGAATVTVSGGTAPYDIAWSNGTLLFGVGAGNYNTSALSNGAVSVTITDANGCNATANTTITQPTQLTVSVGSATNILCNGLSTGAVNINVNGGTGSKTYAWTGGYTTEDISNVPAGTYNVTVTDQNTCTATTGTTLTQPTAALAASSTVTNVSCFGGANGAIDLTVTGGTTPYSYAWSNSATSQDITSIGNGAYTVTITDGNNCTLTHSKTVTQPTNAVGLSVNNVTNVSCFGGSNGSVTISGIGGTPPYTYAINAGSFSANATFGTLSAGSYTFRVRDANNCETSVPVTVSQPAASLTAIVTNVTQNNCFGGAIGAIDITVTGGTPNYTYAWSHGPATQDVTGLAAASYTITVTDFNSCTASATAVVTQPAQLTATAAVTNVTGCQGFSNGAITFTASGGSGLYAYSINGGSTYQTSATFTGLAAGTYDVYIRDNNVPSCARQLSPVTITQPASLAAPTYPGGTSYTSCGLLVVNVTPQGGADEAVLYDGIPGGGGTPIDTSTAFLLNTLTTGTHTFYTTSYSSTGQCQGTAYSSFTVTVTNPVLVSGVVTDVTCFGSNNGGINITPSGGTPPYTYNWSNSSSSQDINGVGGGSYNVVVTDAQGCFNIGSYRVVEFAPVNASIDAPTYNGYIVRCSGDDNGVINVNATGGDGTYTYLWNDASTLGNRNDIGAGTYTVTVTDGKGCSTVKTTTLFEPSPLSLTLQTSYQCSGGGYSSATVQIIPTGGQPPYQFSKNSTSFLQTSNTFSNLSNGSTDTFYVFDGINCSAFAFNTVTLPAPGTALNSCDLIYVAPNTEGGDVNNAGTPDCPTTLQQAMNLVSGTRNVVRLLGGTSQYFYSTPVNLVNNVTIEGGYTRDINGTWIKSTTTPTIINFDGAYVNPATGVGYYAGFVSTAKTGWNISDVTVNVQVSGAVGSQDGNGRSVYGFLVNSSSSNYALSNVVINTGDASNGANGFNGQNGENGTNGTDGAAGQFIQDNTNGSGPFPTCCGGGTGGNGGDGGGVGGTGTTDPGALSNGNTSSCVPYGSPSLRGGGGGGSGGHGGSTDGLTLNPGRSGARGGGGGLTAGVCGHTAAGAAVANNNSPGYIWAFYSQPQPAPAAGGVDGNNGVNGGNASTSYTPGNTPNSASFGNYYVPGKGADGGNGFGGSGGSGGGGTGAVIIDGRFGGSPAFLNVVRGSAGGAGGGGGEGGEGGAGGGGGGAAFGMYVAPNSTSGASLTGVIISSLGSAGTGGTGGTGGSGGTGGFGGQGGPAMSDTQLGIVVSNPAGSGGNGGNGGIGGRGQDGDNGTNAPIYFGGSSAPAQTPAGSNGTVTVSTIKACTNSIIPITKTSNDNWVITGGNFVNNLTSSTSTYTAASDTAEIYYTSIGNKNVGVGTTTYNALIKVSGTRPVPTITTAPFGTICEGSTINLATSATGVQHRWIISSASNPSVNLGVLSGQTISNVLFDTPGTYQIKLQVREECCGWSIPVYASVTVSPLPSQAPTINGPATVCAGQSVTYSAPLVSNAAANVNTTTGYKWQLPSGATVTSAGGLNGFVSGGNINITVTTGTNSGNVVLTPSNACGDGLATTLAVTVAPTPVITGISGNTTACAGDLQVLTPVVTGATSPTYLWSNGATTASINVSPMVTTTYTVTVTQGSCSDVESKTINVTPVPSAPGAITGLTSVFYGQAGVTYSIASVPNAASYNWTVPSGATIVSGQGTTSITVNFGTATSGNVSVTPVNGSCSAAASTLFVNISAAPFVWTGNTSDNWHVGSNWSTNTVPTASNNVLIPSGRPNYPASYSGSPVANEVVVQSGASITLDLGVNMDVNGNFFLLSGASLQFPSNPLFATLRIGGNVDMTGTLVSGTGSVILDGTTVQTVTGSNNIVFEDLTINNNNGVSIIGGTVYVHAGLNLDAGVLTTNNRLVLKSDLTGTGWVDNFSPGMNGSISGDIRMQRFFPASALSTAFHYISSPVSNGAVSQLSELGLYGPDGGQVIPIPSCDPNNIASNSPYGTLFEWRENASFLFNCNQSGWHVRSGGNMTDGRGYAAVIRRNADFTLEIQGTANTGNVNYSSLANTTAVGDGWHLVSNPYPSPIEWNVPAGFIGAAHFWQSSGSYTGTYQPQLSGIGHNIPSMQAFFIQTSSGPANFVLNQSDRRTGDPTFQRQANWYDHILNVELAGNGFADRTVVYFSGNCSDNWDDLYDAQKKESRAGQPTLYTRIANYPKFVGINGLPTNNSQVVSVPMGFIPGTAGSFTFTFNDISTFDASTLIYLEDTKTGTFHNLRVNNEYTFNSTLNDDTERFIIHFYPPATLASVDADCEGLNGAINVDLGVFNVGGTILTWDSYELSDANGNVVSSANNVNGTINVANVAAGDYTLNLNIQGYQTSDIITVGAPAPVAAEYMNNFSTAYTQAILEFVNQSANATDFAWTFGDGTTSTLENPTHIYTAPGIYDVTLVATNGTCTDTYTSKVEVLEVAVGLPTDIQKPMVNITSYQDVVTLGFLNLSDPNVQVDIFDLTGRKIIETLNLETGQTNHEIKLNYIPSGYYFVRVTGTNTYADKKVFLTSEK